MEVNEEGGTLDAGNTGWWDKRRGCGTGRAPDVLVLVFKMGPIFKVNKNSRTAAKKKIFNFILSYD